MSRLKEHEVLHLIDRVVLDLDRSSALAKLILHCRIVLDDQYDQWETRLRAINGKSKSITEAVFARGIYDACGKYDETKGVPFPLFAIYSVNTAIRREMEQILYKSHGTLRQRECKYMLPGDADGDLVYDEYSCKDRCDWMDDYNKPRPCKVYYTPRGPKPDPLPEPDEPMRSGRSTRKSKVAIENVSRSARPIRYDAFVSFDEEPKTDLVGEAGPDPSERYMLEHLQQASQQNPLEDAYLSAQETPMEEKLRRQLDTLPPMMRDVMIGYYGGIDRSSGLYNVGAVAEKHSLTPDDVRDIIRASIQRLKRHGMTE